MTTRQPSPENIAAEIRHLLRNRGSAEHADGVQWFFKDEINRTDGIPPNCAL
jgi:hypothetical protein